MGLILTNRASSLLSSGIGPTTTTIAITSGDEGLFPSPGAEDWFPVVILDAAGNFEVARCTARSGVTLTVERAQEGTSGQTFSAGAEVSVRFTAGAILEETGNADRLTSGEVPNARLPARLQAYAELVTDADDITDTGFYQVAADASNIPVAAIGYIWHMSIDADDMFQQFQAAASGARYARRQEGSAWTDWLEVWNSPVATNIASATTTNLANLASRIGTLTGSVTITGFGTMPAGVERTLILSGAPLITHNGTSLILPGAANIQGAAGDIIDLLSLGSGNWRCMAYKKASGAPAGTRLPTDTMRFADTTDITKQLAFVLSGFTTATTRSVTWPDQDGTVLLSTGEGILTGGFTATEDDDGAISSGTYTPTPVGGNFKAKSNTGAHTFDPPAVSGAYTLVVDYTNGSGAGAIATSGWTWVTGDPFTTTVGHKFRCYCSKGALGSHLHVQAFQ